MIQQKIDTHDRHAPEERALVSPLLFSQDTIKARHYVRNMRTATTLNMITVLPN